MIEDKESQGTDGENIRALHQNQHTYSRKSNQRISVLVTNWIFKSQNIAKVPNSDSHIVQILLLTISMPYICNSRRRDQIKNQMTA